MTEDMSPLMSFFHMGGYWPYIWPAYGVVAVLFIGLLVWTLGCTEAITARTRSP